MCFRAFCSVNHRDKFICYICEECVRLIQVLTVPYSETGYRNNLSVRTCVAVPLNCRNDAFRTDVIHLRIAFVVKTSCVGMTLVVQNMDNVKCGKCCV